MIDLLIEPEVIGAVAGGIIGAILASSWPRNRWVAYIVFSALGVVIGFVAGAILDTQGVSTILETP